MATHNTDSNNPPKELPDDIIPQIFKSLPVKSICKFRCCSKFINEFTQDREFLKRQSENSLLKDDPCFFIQPKDFLQDSGGRIELYTLPGENTSSCGIHSEFLKFLQINFLKILASSNGLLLCKRATIVTPKPLFIFNPTSFSCYMASNPVRCKRILQGEVSVDYAFECNSEEYKLFAFVKDLYDPSSLSLDCSIYDQKEHEWKEIEAKFFVGDRKGEFDSLVFYKGIIHVLSKWDVDNAMSASNVSKPYIATYNYESGISSMLSVPKESTDIFADDQNKCHDIQVGIFKWGKVRLSNESICLVRMDERCVFGIWVLSDYESQCWIKFMRVSLEEIGFGKEDSSVVGFTIMNGDSLVFATKKWVFRYDLMGQRKTRLEKVCEHELTDLSFVSYSSSFRMTGRNSWCYDTLFL